MTVRRLGARARRPSEADRTPGDGTLLQNRQKTSQKRRRTTRKAPETRGNRQKTARILPLPDRILAALRQNPSASRRELAAVLGTTQSTVRYRLEKLRAAGRIERVGPDKGGHWRVLDVAHTEAGQSR